MYSKKILIIDDSKVIRESLKKLLLDSTLGFREKNIETFEDGDVALEYLHNNHVDIIFVDYEMPRMDGLEFTKSARKIFSKEQLNILLITSNPDRRNIVNILRSGVNNYIIKPFEKQLVFEKIVYTLGLEDKYLKKEESEEEK